MRIWAPRPQNLRGLANAAGLPLLKGGLPVGGVQIPINPQAGGSGTKPPPPPIDYPPPPTTPLKLKEIQLPPGAQPGIAIDQPGANGFDTAFGLTKYFTDDAYKDGFDGVRFIGAQGPVRTLLMPTNADYTVITGRPFSFKNAGGTGIELLRAPYIEFVDIDVVCSPNGFGKGFWLNAEGNPGKGLLRPRPAVVRMVNCNIVSAGKKTKWGVFGYQCSLTMEQCAIFIPDSQEHCVYMHGFGTGPEFGLPSPGLRFIDCFFQGGGINKGHANPPEGVKVVNRPPLEAYTLAGVPFPTEPDGVTPHHNTEDGTPFVPGATITITGCTFRNNAGSAVSLQGPQAANIYIGFNVMFHTETLFNSQGNQHVAKSIGIGFGGQFWKADGTPNPSGGSASNSNDVEPDFFENGAVTITTNLIVNRRNSNNNNDQIDIRGAASCHISKCGCYEGGLSPNGLFPVARVENVGTGSVTGCNTAALDAIAEKLQDALLGGLPGILLGENKGAPLNVKTKPTMLINAKKVNPSFGPSFLPISIDRFF